MDEDGVRKVAALLLPARFPFHGGRCSPKIVRYALQARPATEPRRADARRSCECAFLRECRYFSADGRRAPGAAGVSQPWHADVLSPGTAIASASALPNLGGLTPAALVNERMCIAQVAVSPANVRTAEPPRAGGVSPPW
jgi:hypothetical protein